MKHLILVLISVAMMLSGCVGDGSANTSQTTTKTTVRSYVVDCGEATTIGNGSCGLTVTSVSILGGGGQ